MISLAIWIPMICGGLILLSRKHQVNIMWWLALFAALISFALTLSLAYQFDSTYVGMQFNERYHWIPYLNAHYALGIDGASLWLLVLTAFVTTLVLIHARAMQKDQTRYLALVLILSGLLLGAFSAQDGLLFYLFFEATLIPMYLIIGIWGGNRRIYAAFKFFLYTLLGSLFALLAILYLYRQTGSFEIIAWQGMTIPFSEQVFLFLAFLLAFAVKVPMWPVHTWLPDAHGEAPTGGSVVLAAVMLKLGAYGLIRFCLSITPDASRYFAPMMIALSLIAIIYISLIALIQKDMKKMIAYSSIAHMGLVTLGLFLFQDRALQGAVFQMISHGFVSAGLFFCIGVLYDRMHSREIKDYSGIIAPMPKFASFFLLLFLANCGLPGTSGFVGEWLVIIAAVQENFIIGMLAASSLVLSAAYSLWLGKRVLFGSICSLSVAALPDVDRRECFILAVLALCVLGFGLYPRIITDMLEISLMEIGGLLGQSKIE